MSASSIPSRNDLSPQQAQAVEEICGRFAEALRTWTDRRPRVEAFLAEMPNPARAVLLLRLIRLELETGPTPEATHVEEYRQRFSNEEGFTQLLDAILGQQGTIDETSEGSLDGSEPSESEIGRLAEYELLGILGRGGMGIVHKARHKSLDRIVALKRILAGDHADPQQLERFRIEAEAVARLQHPHIVQIFEVGQQDGLPYFSLEYCAGGSLKEKLAGTPLAALESAHLVEQLARGMEVAHQKGVIHRDLKPANVLLAEDGTPKIADFGLAKKLDDVGQTQTGAVVGTPSYMAPEQAAGNSKEIGPACDVYALGAILYECLTGRPPFRAANVMDTLLQVVQDDPVSPNRLNAKVPIDLETICLKCLAKEPEQRYASAGALAEDLARFQHDEPIQARPVGRVERLWRWCVRNPALASALTTAVAILLAGAVVSSAFAVKANHNASQAQKAREEAEDSASTAWEAQRDAEVAIVAEADARLRAERLAVAESQARQQAEVQRKRAEQLAAAEAKARRRIDTEHKRAESEKRLAQEQRDWAEYHLYVGQLSRAQREFEAGNGGRALQLLNRCQWNLRGWEHAHLWSRFHSKQTLIGHFGPVHSVSFSPDGKQILSGSADKTLKLWDARTGQMIHTFKGHSASVYSVSFSPDGNHILSGSGDKTLKLWDAQSGQVLQTLTGHTDRVSSVSFDPNGELILSGSWDKTVKLWNAQTGQEIRTFNGHAKSIQSASFSPDSTRILSGSSDMTSRVWDVQSGQQILALRGHLRSVTSGCFSPDGKRILSGSGDKTLKLWDAQSGQELFTLAGHMGYVHCVSFSPDGRRIVSGSFDNTLKLWDAETGQELFTLRGHAASVESVRFCPNGKCILSGSTDKTLKLWDAQSGQEILTLSGHLGAVFCGSFSPDSKRFLSASADSTLKLWDARTGQQLRTLEGHTGNVSSVSFSPDSKRFLSGSSDKSLKLWDARTGRVIQTLTGHGGYVNSVCFSPDGQRILSASVDKTLKLWDARTGQEIRTLTGHANQVTSASFSPDGKKVLSGSFDKTLKLWDARTGQVIHTFKGHSASVSSVSFSPDGEAILSGSGDKTMKLWDARTGQEIFTLKGHAGYVQSVSFSPDGSRILSGSWDNTLKLWDTQTGQELLTLKGHTDYVRSVGFSPDGKRILSGSLDKTLKLWDAQTGQVIRTFTELSGTVLRVRFSPDGKRVFGQDHLGRVLGWDTHTGQLLPDRPSRLPEGPPLTRVADGRFLGISGNNVLLSDPNRQQRSVAHASSWFRRWSRFDPVWHRKRLHNAGRSSNVFAESFHRGRLLRAYPYDANLHLQQAHTLAELGKPTQATIHLMHALFLHPQIPLRRVDPSALARGHSSAKTEDWERAVAAFDLARRQPQASPYRHLELLLAQSAAGQTAQAQRTLREIVALLPTIEDARIRSALLFNTVHLPSDRATAESLVRATADALANQRNPITLYRHGAALYRAGHLDEATKVLAESNRLHPEGGYMNAFLFQALVAREQGRFDEANELFGRVQSWHVTYKPPTWQMRVLWESLLREATAPPRMPRVAE